MGVGWEAKAMGEGWEVEMMGSDSAEVGLEAALMGKGRVVAVQVGLDSAVVGVG